MNSSVEIVGDQSYVSEHHHDSGDVSPTIYLGILGHLEFLVVLDIF